MATAEQEAAAYYQQQKRLSTMAARAAAAEFAQLDEQALSESWTASIGPRIVAMVTQAQLAAASGAPGYLARLSAAQGMPLEPPPIIAEALSGIASDGRPLSSLLYLPVMLIKRLIGGGVRLPDAMERGRNFTSLLASTQVADAGRVATTVGIAADRTWVTYVRHVELPACSRCIVLSGREYSWSTGFQRHPQCDCVMIGRIHHADGSVGGPDPSSPAELFAQMTTQEQDRRFGKAGAEAIRLGADLGQVVNARRGMATAGGKLVTTEGTTRRGVAGQRMGSTGRRRSPVRLMPEQILADAHGDRDEVVRLLERFGYLAPSRRL